MPSIDRPRTRTFFTFAVGALLALCCAWPHAARAQAYGCAGAGPGEMQVGQLPSQGIFMALCVRVDQGESTTGNEQSGPAPDPWVWQDRPVGSDASDTYEDRLRYYMQLTAAGDGVRKELAELQRDPRYAIYRDGGWEVFQTQGPRRGRTTPGEYCTALYGSPEGMVVIAGPGGESTMALLTFIGPDIPVPDAPGLVPVSLLQTGSATPTIVRAHNYQMPETELGAITFAVPSLQAALQGMFDVANFELAMNEQVVMKIDWDNGLSARDGLAECATGR